MNTYFDRQAAMQMTERDRTIFVFINQFGFCETVHLAKRFNLNTKNVNKIMRRLVYHEYVIKQKQFYGKYALYRLTNKGAQFTSLSPLPKLSAGAYHHTTALIELYLKIMRQYPSAKWVSERMLLTEKYSDGVGKSGHTPDALLIKDDKQIAVEVELTSKSKKRLESIINSYATDLAIHEVWYFCSNEVIAAVKKAASHLPFVKIHVIDV